MISEIKRIARLPRTIRIPFNRGSPEQRAADVVGDLVRLPEFANKLLDVGQVMGVIGQKVDQNPYLGRSTKDIDGAIAKIKERVSSGLLTSGVANNFLDALHRQRDLSLQQPHIVRDQLVPIATEMVGGMIMTRRGALVVASAGLLTAGEVYRRNLASKPRTESPVPVDLDKELDSQPKIALENGPSNISKEGWRVRVIDGTSLKPDPNTKNRVWTLENGELFRFTLDGKTINTGIAVRGLHTDKGVVPFFRVYPKVGIPKDYIVQTNKKESGDLVTNAIVFEKGEGIDPIQMQFNALVSGNAFSFLGRPLILIGSGK